MLTIRGLQRDRCRERGQALVEFGLVAIPMLLFMVAAVQFGMIFATQIGLTNAARETARIAAAVPTTNGSGATTNGSWAYSQLTTILPRNVQTYIAANFNDATGTPPSTIAYCSYQDPSGDWSIRVMVRLYYRHPLIMPLVSQIIDGIDGAPDSAFLVGGGEDMRVENVKKLTALPSGIAACP